MDTIELVTEAGTFNGLVKGRRGSTGVSGAGGEAAVLSVILSGPSKVLVEVIFEQYMAEHKH